MARTASASVLARVDELGSQPQHSLDSPPFEGQLSLSPSLPSWLNACLMEDEYLYPDEDEAFELALLSLPDPEPAFSSSSNIPSSSTSTTPRTRPISPSKPHSTYTERDTSNTSPVKTSFTLREGDVKLDGSARNGEVLQWKRMERDQQRETSVLGQKRPAPKDDTYNPVGFGEFGRYMRNKRAKLQLQNKALIEEDSKEVAQVFKGLAIYVRSPIFSFSARN